MIKSELRKIFLSKQKNLSPAERKQKSERISGNFFEAFDLGKINFLHCFLPIERFNEIDTRLIFQKIWSEFTHVKTVVPRINFENHEIENRKFAPETVLIQNVWKIHEPAHTEIIETREIDAALIPLLCFDNRGYRVGYGKGFYDGFLKKCRPDCLKIGLSYFEPVTEISDAWDLDVKIDFCVTPETIFKAG